MFLISWNIIYIIFLYSLILWFTFILTFVLYSYNRVYNIKNKISQLTVHAISYLPMLYFILLTYIACWLTPDVLLWFGHSYVTKFTFKYIKILIFILFNVLILLNYLLTFFNKNTFDFILIFLNLNPWFCFIISTTSYYTFIFLLELLVILMFLLIPLSLFLNFNKVNYKLNNIYFNNTVVNPFVNSLLFYYWVSFLTSILLFINIFFIHNSFFSNEWFVLEFILLIKLNILNTYKLTKITLIFIILILVFFIKFAVLPFFVWKILFFKSITYMYILIYVLLYFNILLINFIWYLYYNLLNFYLIFKTLMLFIIIPTLPLILLYLFNYTYIKSFIAISSLFNLYLMLLALNLLL